MKFLIVDDFHPSIFDMMDEQGWQYQYEPSISRDKIKDALPEYEGLLIRSKTIVDADLVESSVKLKVVGRAGSGTENIDKEYMDQRGISVVNAPEGNRDAVGDHVLGLILALTKNIYRSATEIKIHNEWNREKNRGHELNSLTVGIIGYGNTGSTVAKRLRSFDCKILVYDKYKRGVLDDFVEECSLREIQEKSDILTFHIPLTPDSRYMINEEFLSGCERLKYLVNTSRGEILDTKALVKGLNEGKISGAALDVIENEKIHQLTDEQAENFRFLQNSPNVILTPHVAGWTFESYIRINKVLIEKIKSLI